MPTPNELPTAGSVQPSDALLVERAGALLRTPATEFTGPEGPQGPQGEAGIGVPAGGADGFVLAKASASDYDTEWVDPNTFVPVQSVAGKTGDVILVKGDVGLGNVDNTSDLNKPISTATQTALDGKVDENAPVSPGTFTKITYDAKGLVTSGSAATTTDITEGTNLYFTNTRARSALSAGTGISYDSGTGVISCTITQYTDTQARAALSAGAGISYNNLTGVIASTITQYTDALARASLSAGTGITYNPSTGVISSSITQYTDEDAQDAVGAMANSTLTYVDATPSLGINLGNANTWTAAQTFNRVNTPEIRMVSGALLIADDTGFPVFSLANLGPADNLLQITATTTVNGDTAFNSVSEFAASFRRSFSISPANLAANTNDWNPTDLQFATVILLNQTTSSISLTGLSGGVSGREILFLNTGTQAITLANESASSTAANRFTLGSDFSVAPKSGVYLWYDGGASRWRPVHPLATGGGGGTPGETKNQLFLSGAGFTAGTTTTLTLTTTPIAPSSASLRIFFDGIRQFPSEWSYDPGTGVITFNAAIPLGTQAVFTEWESVTVPVGTPSDGTVSWAKLASGLIASVAEMVSGTADKIISAANLKTYIEQNVTTPWVAYTPTFTGHGAATSVSFFSRRVGDTLEVEGKFTQGTPTPVEARISLGFNGVDGGITVASAKVPSGVSVAGVCAFSSSAAASMYILKEPSVGYVTWSYQAAVGGVGTNKANGNIISGSAGTTFTVKFSVPIQGW